MNNPVIYISEYFDILVSLQTRDSFSIRERYRQLYELLDLFSRQLLSDKGKNYPNLLPVSELSTKEIQKYEQHSIPFVYMLRKL